MTLTATELTTMQHGLAFGTKTIPAVEYYTGDGGAAYLGRNALEPFDQQRFRAIRGLVPEDYDLPAWVELGCGVGANLCPGDIGIDCDARVLEPAINMGIIGLVGTSPFLHFLPDNLTKCCLAVGLLMHLNHALSDLTIEQMQRISSKYIILGEYIDSTEREIPWHDVEGGLFARPYDVPGWTKVKETMLEPFGPEVTFQVWEKP